MNAEGKVIEHDIDLDDEDAQQLYKSVCSVPYVEGQPLKVLSGQELDFNLLRSIRIDEDVWHMLCCEISSHLYSNGKYYGLTIKALFCD